MFFRCNPMNQEIWKDIAESSGGYQVSDLGRVRLAYGEIVSPTKANSYGHLAVRLKIEGKSKQFLLHRLVATAFHGDPDRGSYCCHGNGDPKDNRSVNLRWASPKENAQDTVAHGRTTRGERNGNSKIHGAGAERIRDLRRMGVKCRDVGKWIGVSASQVSNIERGIQRAHQ